jgi:DNA-binding XRE family transcriptional regulator
VARKKKDEATGFAARLKQIREEKGMTQDGLAQSSGLNRFSVAKLEQGQREPNWPTVLRLAKALGVGVEAFKDDTPPDPEPPKKPRKKK